MSVRHDLNDAFFFATDITLPRRYRSSGVFLFLHRSAPTPLMTNSSRAQPASPKASEISQLLRLPKIVAAIRNSEQFGTVTQSSYVTSGNQQHTPSIPTN
ncbi:hypothetical protein C5D65_04170 [Rathayibacter toxicus]|uniref:Uncharacterized protein n=1 Tax=Rathayibacter toxicus TaxID=145458 RepID=A0A0U1PTG1_9MICO|nr:hypothetical protein VT73_05530 [Rathayibacter toxicus]PPH92808.1 hypothetical protein C5D37_04150 [Rathayibacter toxicus]PPI32042.1 hypothetical protein C5D65_04170 [Rathayibacter toxicus]PPI53928.1 hypothetical protein C5D33_04170 [Rathayibacter toxicus]